MTTTTTTRERTMHLRRLLRDARTEGTRRMTTDELEQKVRELGLEEVSTPSQEPEQPEH